MWSHNKQLTTISTIIVALTVVFAMSNNTFAPLPLSFAQSSSSSISIPELIVTESSLLHNVSPSTTTTNTSSNSVTVQVNSDAFDSEQMYITAFDETFLVKHEKTIFRDDNDFTYIGSIEPHSQNIFIAYYDGELRVEMNMLSNYYEMISDNDTHTFTKFNGLGFGDGGEGDTPLSLNPNYEDIIDSLEDGTFTRTNYNTIQIDIIFLTTDAVDDAFSSTQIRQMADLGIDKTNNAFEISDIPLELVRVAIENAGSGYAEVGMVDDRDNLTDPDDGNMDRGYALRDTEEADMGILFNFIPSQPLFAGIAAEILASEENAFAVVNTGSVTPIGSVIAHELGHLAGAYHDFDTNILQGNPEGYYETPFTFGHGYEDSSFRLTSLMGYPCSDCFWIDQWSDPGANFANELEPAGTEDHEDVAKVWRLTGTYLASFNGGTETYVSNDTTPSVPDAPIGLETSAISSNTVTLGWTTPANDGGAPITGYQIEREFPPGTGFDVIILDTESTSTTFTDNTGLSPNTTYNYRVSAINDVGISIVSAETSATTTTIDTILSTTTIPNPDPEIGDFFGFSVAGLGDNKIIVGTRSDDPDGITDAGSVYVFDATDGKTLLTIPNPEPDVDDFFGISVAGLGDDKIIVGDDLDDPDGITDAGSVYVFDATDGKTLLTIPNPEPAAGDHFGWSVAGLGDDKIIVSAHVDDPDDIRNAGSVYVFDATDGKTLLTIPNPDPQTKDYFGHSVAGLGDNKIIVSARSDDPDGITDAGSVYVFDATDGKTLLTIPNPEPQTKDYFGHSVAGLGDNKIIVGAWSDDPDGITDAGSVYVFDATDGKRLLTILHPDFDPYDFFGFSVKGLGNDMIIVSAPLDETSAIENTGSVYIFDANTGLPLLTIPNPDPEIDDRFGNAVAGVGGGNKVIVSMAIDNPEGIDSTGSVYVFELGSGLESDPDTAAAAAAATKTSPSSVP